MKIDKNIPIPIGKHNLPFDEMEVGDSFRVQMNYKRLANVIQNNQKSRGKKFTMRTVTEDNDKFIRVWRVE